MTAKSTAGHTPGPWIARRGTIGTAQYHIAEMMPSAYPDMPPCFPSDEQQEANAALIAAAPETAAERDRLRESNAELIDVLRETLHALECTHQAATARGAILPPNNEQRMDAARAALARHAKAEGRS